MENLTVKESQMINQYVFLEKRHLLYVAIAVKYEYASHYRPDFVFVSLFSSCLAPRNVIYLSGRLLC